jgi:hypothetical protein
MADLSPYEQRALAEVDEHKRDVLSRSPRRLVPDKVRDGASRRASAAEQRLRSMPGGDAAMKRIVSGYTASAKGIGKFVTKSGQISLSEERIVRAYRRRGHDVTELEHVRGLDLRVIEKHVRPKRMDFLYASTAALEGMAAGAVISGGEALATLGSVFGAGVPAAPGLGAVASAMAGDAAFVLAAGSRAAAHIAMYYGYDTSMPSEEIFIMGVLNLGTAATAGAKYYAYRELSQLAQGLARRATWATLDKHVLTQIAKRFSNEMSVRLTQRKMGQLVPVAGIAVGAGLNYRILDQISDAAYWTYRERFLHEKRGGSTAFTVPSPPGTVAPDDEGAEETPVSVLELLEPEADLEPGD